MNKHHLSKILAICDLALVTKIADAIEEKAAVRVHKAPQTALIMMKARDSVSTQPFHMGEVLVTECRVAIAGAYGIGIVIGEQPERAYGMAVIDAACNAGMPVLDTWGAALEEEERRIFRKRAEEAARLSRSKVDFDTMGEYDAHH